MLRDLKAPRLFKFIIIRYILYNGDNMRSFLSLFILLIASSTLQAQRYGGENLFPQQANIEHNQAVMNFSRDFVSALGQLGGVLRSGADMVGDANQVASSNVIGNANSLNIVQNGTLNFAGVNIVGSSNSVNVSQNGSDNLALLNILGSSNNLSLTQNNNNNIFRGLYIGSGITPAPMIQNGNSSVTQLGVSFIPLEITTTAGQGVPVIIQPGN